MIGVKESDLETDNMLQKQLNVPQKNVTKSSARKMIRSLNFYVAVLLSN